MDKLSIVVVTPRKDFPRGWKFVCQYCRRVHLHGQGLGHRASHCFHPKADYDASGYYIVTRDIYDKMQALDPDIYIDDRRAYLERLISEKNRQIEEEWERKIEENWNKHRLKSVR